MREVLGEALARQLVDHAQRAVLRETGQAERGPTGAAKPRTAKVKFAETAERSADSKVVRRIARMVLHIAAWMGTHGDGRTGSSAQRGRLAMGWLVKWVGVQRRELARYLAVLRRAGVMDSWQPPQTSGMPRGSNTGMCFAVYRFCQGVPAALRARLECWRQKMAPKAARELSAPATAAQAPRTGTMPASVAAILAMNSGPPSTP